VGGSHAHKFKKVIEALGIATLIVTDLDSVIPTKSTDKNGNETTKNKAIAPAIKAGHLTANYVLKEWHPKQSQVDDLLSLNDKDHATQSCKGALYVAFQKEVERAEDNKKLIPRTFEDALIFENPTALKEIEGNGTSAKVRELLSVPRDDDELANEIFLLVQKAKKGDFALDCLMLEKGENTVDLKPPHYIAAGLSWLEQYLNEHSLDISGGV
jgi:predicted ATP-dependent endonuclease of OLD family